MVDILQITFLSSILHVIFLQFFTVDVSIKLPSNFFLNFVILQLPQLFSVQGGFKLAYSFRNPASYIRANIPDALNLSVTILNLLQIKKNIYIYFGNPSMSQHHKQQHCNCVQHKSSKIEKKCNKLQKTLILALEAKFNLAKKIYFGALCFVVLIINEVMTYFSFHTVIFPVNHLIRLLQQFFLGIDRDNRLRLFFG